MPYPDFPITRIGAFNAPSYKLETVIDQEFVERRINTTTASHKASLSLFYDRLSAEQVLELISFYNQYLQTSRGFSVARSLLPYGDYLSRAYLNSLKNYIYYFKDKPRIKTLITNIYQVEVELEASEAKIFAPPFVRVIDKKSVTVSVQASPEYVFWEQVSGLPATIGSPYSLSTTITAAGDLLSSVDSRLIFKVSLQDNPDVFELVEIITNPSSNIGFKVSSLVTRVNRVDTDYSVPFPLYWDNQTEEPVKVFDKSNVTDIPIRWDEPLQGKEYLQGYSVQVKNESGWETLKYIEKDEPRKVNIPDTSTTFRIASHLVIAKDKVETYYTSFLTLNPAKCRNVVIALREFPIQAISQRVFYQSTSIKFGKSVQNFDDSINLKANSDRVYLKDVNRIPFTYTTSEKKYGSEIEDTVDETKLSLRVFLHKIEKVDFGGTIIG